MASKPGFLTDWPWTFLGSYKYVVLAPFAIKATYSYMTKGEGERDLTEFLILPFLIWRMVHDQIWISFSRYRTAQGANRIVDKSIEFDQVDRERNWDDQIIFNGLLFYGIHTYIKQARHLPLWRTDGVILTALLHVGPVEYLYYWLHRALHHHFLYSRYHSHHHSSIVTEPITSVIHPFGEHIAYFTLFATPILTTICTRTASLLSIFIYITYIDFMNNMGHCNFEHIPKWLFSVFPPLKYIMYTPSFHSLHHTQFRTNYSLFMPFYDYVYGTMDQSSDLLYEKSLVRKEESPDVVHLTHLTTPNSIYYLRLGFAYLAAEPHKSKWYLWLMWPVTLWSMAITLIYGRTFIIERNLFKRLKMQTWAVPKYTIQYYAQRQRESINKMIEDAILEAEEKEVKVISLGLLNQDEGLNGNGELFLTKHPELKVKLVDGSSLTVAIVRNSIPEGTTQVLLRGHLNKVAYSIAQALCQDGVEVISLREDEYKKLKSSFSGNVADKLGLSQNNLPVVWLVGDGLSDDDQLKASKGTIFIPFSQFPPKKARKDCVYNNTPSMLAPKHFENVDSCENWLPRRVMSAQRIAGILHAVEDWSEHECGNTMLNVNKIWQASLEHGFRPLTVSATLSEKMYMN
ncbi:very-long-chain aldehyde decarbonylase CER1-like isoform X1 [Andrographis paniculata]|uniref:very-long-chain aldehyde decarbonylase CER1-like isoform X1 n=1 Tax=Andrographis paniculata TaxID=175694 RepID=UPI0021E8734D|nr:very-long-chain aldehyde decarbonylase CER1-like isoform X1 [Andrographis paniculata]